ncbi:hypothetical protein JCM33774_10530 [Actinophytocola sp. KF-1]
MGAALGVTDGVSVLFTALSGSTVFGGLALLGLRDLRRDQKLADTPRWGTAPPGTLADQDQVPLRDGPGLAVRWVVAVPLMLVTTLLPTIGQLAVLAWGRASRSSTGLTFSQAFGDSLGDLAYLVVVPVFALLVFLVVRTMFAAWPKTCLWLAVYTLAPSTVLSLAIHDVSALPSLALGAGLVWLNHELGKLTLWRLSRPVTRDLALSELEIPYRVPGARLRVRRERLLLDGLGDKSVHQVILWPELTVVRVERVAEPTVWEIGSSTMIDVPRGHALRLTGVAADWLLPVPERLGEDLAAAISLRATTRRAAEAGDGQQIG